MQKVIIDTDPGQDIDDLLAILFALQRPELDILGITTVTWPSHGRGRLVKRLLRYMDRLEVPVAAGSQLPIRPFSREDFARQFNLDQCMNHRGFYQPLEPRDEVTGLDAVNFIIRTVEAHPGEVALLCIGPLTNIGRVLQLRPDLAGKIEYIAMMGGDLGERREHNINFDYLASEIVLTAGIPVFMGTWSVTRQFTLTMADCAPFAKSPQPVHQALWAAIQEWHPAQNWKPGPVMYDIFPVIWAMRRDLYQVEAMPLRVETAEGELRGRTLVEPGAPVIQVTTGIKAEAVRALYLETVFGTY